MIRAFFLRNKKLIPYWFIVPALAFIVLIYLYPFVYAVTLSFFRASFTRIDKFVGLANYQELLSSQMVNVAIRTGIFVAFSVSAAMVLGMLVALLFNQKFRGRNILRALVCMPWFTPASIVAVLWAWMVHPAYGMVNNILLSMGIINEGIPFLNVRGALSVCIAMRIWRATPFAILSLGAALQSVPVVVYDAAKVDGASRRQMFFYVTLPYIKPVFLITMFVMTCFITKTFDMVWVLTGGGPMNSTEIMSISMYKQAFHFGNIGMASSFAVALIGVLFSLNFVLSRYRER